MSPQDRKRDDSSPRRAAFFDEAANPGLLYRIFESLSLPLLMVDVHDYSVVYMNLAARRFSRQGTTSCFALFHDRDEPCEGSDHECPLVKIRQTLEPASVEHVHRDSDGEDRIVRIHAYPVFNQGGELTHVIEAHLDVTSQRRAEAVLHRSEELTQVHGRLAAVGQLAAGIAHDFNNILQTIGVCGETLERQLAGGHAPHEELVENARIVVEQAERGAHLVRQIQDFSRRSPSDPRPLDLDPFLQDALKLLKRTLPESLRIVFATDFDEHTILADRHQLEQVVTNLAVNARDAMPDGGELRFAVSQVRVGTGDRPPFPGIWPGDWVTVAVSDTGSGIPPQARPHVFEPFFTTKPEGRGTGLGLSQAYGIVKQHGGFIDFSTREDEGTTFRLFFPLCETAAEADADAGKEDSPPRAAVSGNGQTILLVDDEESLLRVVARTLEAHGFRVEATSSGAEALELCAERGEQFELVLSDVLMPDLDGRDLVRQVREKNPEARCLLMSGSLAATAGRPSRPAEADGWLAKPISIDQLIDEVQRALGHKRRRDR